MGVGEGVNCILLLPRMATLLTHLSEHRLVHFVVAVFSVADQVNDNVFMKRLSPLCRHLTDMYHSLWVVSIHMEDRS